MTRIHLGLLGLALCVVAGCSGTTGHLAMATTRDVDLRSIDLDPASHAGRHVVGRSCIRVITAVPVGMPKIDAAIDDALRNTDRQVLTDVVIGYEIRDIPFVYGIACYVAEGDAR